MPIERLFYWLVARDPDDGHLFLIAGGNTEDEARQKGLETLSGMEFEVRGLHTHSLQRASAMVRGVHLERTHSIREARRRQGHEKSLARWAKRRQERQARGGF